VPNQRTKLERQVVPPVTYEFEALNLPSCNECVEENLSFAILLYCKGTLYSYGIIEIFQSLSNCCIFTA
jgi:hypothetical protein